MLKLDTTCENGGRLLYKSDLVFLYLGKNKEKLLIITWV